MGHIAWDIILYEWKAWDIGGFAAVNEWKAWDIILYEWKALGHNII